MNTRDETRREDVRTVEVGGAETAAAVLKLGAGQLDVSGGAEALLEARCADAEGQPEINYEVIEGQGRLEVKQPDLLNGSCKRAPAQWDLRFNNAIPLGLRLMLGSGSARLGLGALNLTGLEVQVGSGDVTADLSGSPAQLERVKLNAASGQLTLQMVGEYPALTRVELGTASGQHDLALAGAFPALERLKVGAASGDINLALAGNYAALKKLDVNTVSGSVHLDLTGALAQDLDVAINSVSGEIIVRVPAGIGIQLKHSSLSGKVVAEGFRRDNGAYVNAAYGEAEVTLRLKVSSVSARIEVQLVEA